MRTVRFLTSVTCQLAIFSANDHNFFYFDMIGFIAILPDKWYVLKSKRIKFLVRLSNWDFQSNNSAMLRRQFIFVDFKESNNVTLYYWHSTLIGYFVCLILVMWAYQGSRTNIFVWQRDGDNNDEIVLFSHYNQWPDKLGLVVNVLHQAKTFSIISIQLGWCNSVTYFLWRCYSNLFSLWFNHFHCALLLGFFTSRNHKTWTGGAKWRSLVLND